MPSLLQTQQTQQAQHLMLQMLLMLTRRAGAMTMMLTSSSSRDSGASYQHVRWPGAAADPAHGSAATAAEAAAG
jgi:hypothetical protein